jgi:hypothetical protein
MILTKKIWLGRWLALLLLLPAGKAVAGDEPREVDVKNFRLPTGLYAAHLNYVAVGGDEDHPDRWEVQKSYLVDLSGSGKQNLVVLVRSFQGESAASAGAFVLEKPEDTTAEWRFVDFWGTGEYARASFKDVDGRPGLEMILEGGLGNHGSNLEILSLRRGKLVPLGAFEGYGQGVELQETGGKPKVVNHLNELPDACEGCQSSYPQISDFDGNSFVARADDFVDCLKSLPGGRLSKEEAAAHAGCFSDVLKKRPDLFGALVQAEYFYRQAGNVMQADRLRQRMQALPADKLSYLYDSEDSKDKRLRYMKEH